jgi:hypothetical protein
MGEGGRSRGFRLFIGNYILSWITFFHWAFIEHFKGFHWVLCHAMSSGRGILESKCHKHISPINKQDVVHVHLCMYKNTYIVV